MSRHSKKVVEIHHAVCLYWTPLGVCVLSQWLFFYVSLWAVWRPGPTPQTSSAVCSSSVLWECTPSSCPGGFISLQCPPHHVSSRIYASHVVSATANCPDAFPTTRCATGGCVWVLKERRTCTATDGNFLRQLLTYEGRLFGEPTHLPGRHPQMTGVRTGLWRRIHWMFFFSSVHIEKSVK